MKYLYICQEAAQELVAERMLQSAEFETGKLFAGFIRGEVKMMALSAKIAAVFSGEGAYIVSPDSRSENYIVFDLEEAPRLLSLDDNGLLLVIQKTLRFAIKLWNGLKPSSHEKVLVNGKAVVFPYPIGMQTDLRAVIERQPDERRRSKRESGSAFLVYKFSSDEGEGVAEIARVTNFRKAGDGRDSALATASEVIARSNIRPVLGSQALAVTHLDASNHDRPAFQAGLDGWRSALTSRQLEFVNRRLDVPHRIEGPAGTGKTLCLVLKCLKSLKDSQEQNDEYRALFIAHSEATKRAIENLFAINDQDGFYSTERSLLGAAQVLRVTTLQALCANLLHQEISESELVDRDAYESKQVQTLYAREAIDSVIDNEFDSHRPFMSDDFSDFISKTDRWIIADMLCHEISVQIKGRADQDLDKYKKLHRLKVGMPVVSEGDRSFVFLMYRRYQNALIASAQFDTDDVVLSAISSLNTPIWRRRRGREGYDGIFIDETHLFNLNELSIFHRLSRDETTQPIAYSVDRSQALGDRGWTDEAFDLIFDPECGGDGSASTPVKSIFRCSPDIVNLAFSVTSSGATLFTNFHDPLTTAISAFTSEEERKTERPVMIQYPSGDAMLSGAFARADALAKEMGETKADVVIIAFGDDIFKDLQERAKSAKKPVEIVKSRGDLDAVVRARQAGRFVLTAPEFVGGLEFSAAVLVGVDGGRVPPKGGTSYEDSQNYLSYASHQRVYVALTRARFRVELLGEKARGISSILSNAVRGNLIDVRDA
ncbi:UvrD-helicase domain-containing protein [Burkholderia sp. AU31624]|uniref:UvrD-helicase domain-containing protein n=1 Tax=unclassified Burkholderia TaxID=2613784 RepID=UPI001CF1B6C0|nr:MULTISPECIES: UvrD-helicase domain-containing protein [unclassified Burkholderia]MCA8065072.1 UvrD-helicase domain-containing protein [Burkholderia sp. AU38729]MCA8254179.1 UvrD-helicase domain-containing protein [Burkholderia sp. AU31624]